MHARALTDPVFLAKVDEANKDTNGTIGPFCRRCHGPVADMSGEASGALSPSSAEGIGCSFCHQVTGVDGDPGNTNQLVEVDGIRRAQLKDAAAPHATAYSEIHTKAEFCGGCHSVIHPANGMHLESTYDEWLTGPYAQEGIVCQDCHMSDKPGVQGPMTGTAAAGGKQRDNIYRMTFVGGNRILGASDVAEARLKSAATMKIAASDVVAGGDEATVSVSITNSGAGHYLPTGLTEIREMWLEVWAVGPGGKTKIGERHFGTILADEKGNHPVEFWYATHIYSDDRIAPRSTVTSDYAFTMPADQKQMTIQALLKYRSIPDDLAKHVGVANPVTVMSGVAKDIYPTAQAKAAAEKALADKLAREKAKSVSTKVLLVIVGILVLALAGSVVVLLVRRKRG